MYVANRVIHAIYLDGPELWYHVSTNDNAADYCSRGMSCSEFTDHPLWWSGPSWLQTSPSTWLCKQTLVPKELSELKSLVTVNLHCTQVENILLSLISRHSGLAKLQRILAWCFRSIANFKNYKSKGNIASLTTAELKKSMKMLDKFTQNYYMGSEISQVTNREQCSKSAQKLSLFLDEEGLLRVGGRIDEATLSLSRLYPL